jgi:hypothetical protein
VRQLAKIMLPLALMAVLATAPGTQGNSRATNTPAAFASPFVALRQPAVSSRWSHSARARLSLPPKGDKRCGLRVLQAVVTNPGQNGVANKVALVALGCPKNTVDAEVMLGDLQKKGFEIVRKPRDADVVIVNTCTFVEDAKSESIEAVLEAVELKSSSAKGVVVTGCMAQRYVCLRAGSHALIS